MKDNIVFVLIVCSLTAILMKIASNPTIEIKPEVITREKILQQVDSDVIIPCGMIGLEHYYVPSPRWHYIKGNTYCIDAICANCGKKIRIMIDTDNPDRFDFLVTKYYLGGNIEKN